MSNLFFTERKSWPQQLIGLNWLLIFLVACLCGTGLLALYAVSQGAFEVWGIPQMYRMLFGFALMFIVALIDIKYWYQLAYFFFFMGLVALLGVEFFGNKQMGAQRWIDLGFMNVQPSEPMRIALILALARYYHRLPAENTSRPVWLLLPLLLIIVPAFIIMRQPDLGTSVLFAVVGGGILFMTGVNWRYFLLGGLSLVPVGMFFWQGMLEYQKLRVLTFLNPERDPLGAGYHIIQSKIAIGSGGVWGKGFMKGTQSQLDFLPEKQTDFIFTMIAEEMGLVGCLVILFLYAGVLLIGFLISLEAKSKFSRLVAGALSLSMFLYLFINVAMVVGLMPVVGVPLPFISYGGTSIVTFLVSIGLLLNIQLHKNVELPNN
ncbi:MAG: rod shape-determining protein RodA [Parvibaculales bacterium]